MSSRVFRTFAGDCLTEDMLADAARLFSENYGVWGEFSGRKGPVKSSPRRLRNDLLPAGATTSYTSVFVDGHLAGHALACRWKHGNQVICWVTQLVVAKEHREMGLATGLLRCLRDDTVDTYGVLSSHPATILAASKAFGSSIEKLDLEFIGKEAAAVMRDLPQGHEFLLVVRPWRRRPISNDAAPSSF